MDLKTPQAAVQRGCQLIFCEMRIQQADLFPNPLQISAPDCFILFLSRADVFVRQGLVWSRHLKEIGKLAPAITLFPANLKQAILSILFCEKFFNSDDVLFVDVQMLRLGSVRICIAVGEKTAVFRRTGAQTVTQEAVQPDLWAFSFRENKFCIRISSIEFPIKQRIRPVLERFK